MSSVYIGGCTALSDAPPLLHLTYLTLVVVFLLGVFRLHCFLLKSLAVVTTSKGFGFQFHAEVSACS